MDFNYKIIGKITGLSFIVLGFSLLPSALVAALYGEYAALKAFTTTALTTLLLGYFLTRLSRGFDYAALKAKDGFLAAPLCWLCVSLLGIFPYVLSGEIPNVIDAFFESVSGISTTGATTMTNMAHYSKSLLFWRAFTEWLGGAGALIFAVALIPAFLKRSSGISDMLKILCAVYLAFTALEVVLLLVGGLPPYDALVHTFSTISTGGFSGSQTVVSRFGDAYPRVIFALFMFAGGISFHLYYFALRHGFREFTKNTEFTFFILIISVSSVLMGANLIFTHTASAPEALLDSVTQTVSIITTTGYVTTEATSLPLFCEMLLFSLMLTGACSASAGGGLKVIRVLMIFRLVTRGIFTRLHPNAVISAKLFDKTLPGETVSRAVSFVFLYITVVFVGSVLISFDRVDMTTCISAVVSSLGNVGPLFAGSGLSVDYTVFSYPARLLLAFIMLLGRAELFIFIMLFIPSFWRPYR